MKLHGLRMAAAGLLAGGLVCGGLAFGGASIADGGSSAPAASGYAAGLQRVGDFQSAPRPCLDPCGVDVVVVDDVLVDPALDRIWIPESPVDGAGFRAQPPAVSEQ